MNNTTAQPTTTGSVAAQRWGYGGDLFEPPVFTTEWYRWLRARHLERYPDLDAGSRRNLDEFVVAAERKGAA